MLRLERVQARAKGIRKREQVVISRSGNRGMASEVEALRNAIQEQQFRNRTMPQKPRGNRGRPRLQAHAALQRRDPRDRVLEQPVVKVADLGSQQVVAGQHQPAGLNRFDVGKARSSVDGSPSGIPSATHA